MKNRKNITKQLAILKIKRSGVLTDAEFKSLNVDHTIKTINGEINKGINDFDIRSRNNNPLNIFNGYKHKTKEEKIKWLDDIFCDDYRQESNKLNNFNIRYKLVRKLKNILFNQ